MVAFVQHAFNVLGFLPAWTIDGWMISCTFDASRLMKAKTFCMAVLLAINALFEDYLKTPLLLWFMCMGFRVLAF